MSGNWNLYYILKTMLLEAIKNEYVNFSLLKNEQSLLNA